MKPARVQDEYADLTAEILASARDPQEVEEAEPLVARDDTRALFVVATVGEARHQLREEISDLGRRVEALHARRR